MDHAINAIRPYYDVTSSMFICEWKTGDYKKISECPSYHELKALSQAINVMSQYYDESNWAETPREIISDLDFYKGLE